MSHFTYKSIEDTSKDEKYLKQGDILKRTEKLLKVIENIHPYFILEDYKYFIVLTQTCDLIQKKEKNKLKYINLAAVRTLSSILEKESEHFYKKKLDKKVNLLSNSRKSYFEDFLTKLLNNNIPEYFYLHDDVDNNISEPHVANLRVSIALKAKEHYDTCLEAKILELKDEFKAKLGWLIGNLYSRVATQDWTPVIKTKSEFKIMINNILEHHFIFKEDTNGIINGLERIKKEDELILMEKDDLLNLIDELKLPDIKSKIIGKLNTILKKSELIHDENIVRISNIIANDITLTNLMKRNN